MSDQAFATAVQYGTEPVVLTASNSCYGIVRIDRDRRRPGTASGANLRNSDFAAYARAFGVHGEVAERTADSARAFEPALEARPTAWIELRAGAENLAPDFTLAGLAQPAR